MVLMQYRAQDNNCGLDKQCRLATDLRTVELCPSGKTVDSQSTARSGNSEWSADERDATSSASSAGQEIRLLVLEQLLKI